MRKNKIRILHVAQAAGGVDRYIRMLLKYLDKEKFENILVCSQDFHEEDYKGLLDSFEQIEMTRAIRRTDLKAIKEVRALIKKYNPDIVYAHSSKAGAIARVADIGIKNCCVYNPHGWAFNMRCSAKKKAMYTAIEKIASPFCDKIICISEAEKQSALDKKICREDILYIYGCYMKEHGELMNNTVVTTVMSNFGLYKAFDEKGIGYAKTAVGDKYVYEYMAKNGCRIGGEQSGHIIFSKYASTGDGILTSLKMMEVMLAKKMPMSKLAEPLKIYPQVLENVRVTDKKAAQNDPAVQEAVKAVAEALGDTGRILVRESGTEPLVRVMVEAPDHDTCRKYVSQVVEVIKNKGYAV